MGVDSGLPDFRGPEGFWTAYPALGQRGLKFYEVASPRTFDVRPVLCAGVPVAFIEQWWLAQLLANGHHPSSLNHRSEGCTLDAKPRSFVVGRVSVMLLRLGRQRWIAEAGGGSQPVIIVARASKCL